MKEWSRVAAPPRITQPTRCSWEGTQTPGTRQLSVFTEGEEENPQNAFQENQSRKSDFWH